MGLLRLYKIGQSQGNRESNEALMGSHGFQRSGTGESALKPFDGFSRHTS
jgi:hypothetical protein